MKTARPLILILLILAFVPNSFAQGRASSELMVRVVYFLPKDRPARSGRGLALRQLIKEAQQFFADEMQRHGFNRKTFTVEMNKNGEPMVHRVDGKFTGEYYYKEGTGHKVWSEVRERFDDFQHIYFIAIDLSQEVLHGGHSCGEAGPNFFPRGEEWARGRVRDMTQGAEVFGGFSVIPASGDCFDRLDLTAHELGHAFGLDHDFRDGRSSNYIMSYGNKRTRLAKCAAEWLSVSHFFNTKTTFHNKQGEIQLLSMRPYSQETTSLHFKVTDPDGLHQAQLLLPDITPEGATGPFRLFDCKRLNGKTGTVESAVSTAELVDRVTLQIIDVNGNITWATLPIQLNAAQPIRGVLDVNNDNIVNIADLTSIASRFGRRGKNPADVNKDRVVNIVDLLLVAANLSSVPQQAAENIAATDVQKWITDAKQLQVENTILKQGIIFLEYLLKETDLSSKSIKGATDPHRAIFDRHTGYVASVAFSRNGQILASGSQDRTIRLWDPHTGQHKILLIGHKETVNSIAFSRNGRILASASWDTTIRLWDPHTGQHITTLRGHTGFSYVDFHCVAFSPDGQILAAGTGGSDRAIRLWDVHNKQYIRTITGHTDRVASITFSPDGRTLASASADKTIKLWNRQTGQLKRTLTGHTQGVESIAFSPDGKTLASGSRDRTIRLWNTQTGKHINTLTGYTDWINPVAFSPNGKMLASGSSDRRIRLWNTQTLKYKNALQEGAGHITSIAFSPNGQMLASGREDGTVRLWDLQTLLVQDPNLTLGPIKITGDVVESPDHSPMYWIDTNSGTLHRLVGTEVENLLSSVRNATSFIVDAADGRIYWGEKTSNKAGRIRSASLDGTNVQLVKKLTSVPFSIALDASGKQIYLTNSRGKIQRLNVDGSNLIPNLVTGLDTPTGLTLDVSNSKVYWTEKSGHIRRANLDGSNIEDVVTGLETPMNLVIYENRIFWTEKTGENRGEIRCTDLNRDSNIYTRIRFTRGFPVGIALHPLELMLYWTTSLGEIGRSRLGGGTFQPNFVTGLRDLGTLAVTTKAPGMPTTDVEVRISSQVGAAERPPMYWIDTKTGTLHSLVGAKVENLVPNVKNVTSLAIDSGDNKIYWTEKTGRSSGSIKRGNLDGSNVQELATLSSMPHSIAIDTKRRKLYWTNSQGSIQRSNLNGKQIKNLVQNLNSPQKIAVDIIKGKLYWTEASGHIRRANLNGKGIRNIASDLSTINGIAISGKKIYWAEMTGKSNGNIQRANLNGSNSGTLARLQSVPFNIAIDSVRNKIYWTDSDGNIQRSNLNGRKIQNVVSGLAPLADFTLGNWSDAPAAAPMNNTLMSPEIPTPEATYLLANYPNPFNPETWIPYQLSKPTDVTVSIYSVDGKLIRTLTLGHQPAGTYQNRSRAAYWDGKNAVGEPVASGVYFYTLTTGEFTATRKLLILK